MDPTNNHIKPLQFKRVAAGNHRDFSTSKQQDVEEYIRFLFEKIAENSRTEVIDPTDSFKFKAINRFEDRGTRRVRYTDQEEMLIRLPISGVKDLLRPIPDTENRYSVDMKAAIHAYFDVQKIDDYISPITGEPKGATNTISMKTFPDYLFFQVSKFAYNVDGTQKKLDMELEIEEELDLSGYRGHGKLEHEIALPDEEPTAPRTTPDIPASVRFVAGELMLMGFCENACYRAAYYSNGNVEIASNWLMEHMDDSDINDLFVIPSGTPSARGEVDPNLVASIVEMGFSNHQAKYALKQVPTVAEAVEWLFANMDSIPVESAAVGLSSDAPEPSVTESATQKTFKDGGEKYKLIGMISHMGSRPDSGHYVAHMLKEGKWVLFNDEKVALSQDPPKKLAYVYLYKRIA